MEEQIEEEIWRDVTGYEGLYEVSSLGRVRSLDKIVNGKCGSTRLLRGRVLKPAKDGGGYLFVKLSKDNKVAMFKVHRLVAMAFQDICGEYRKELEVDHRNCCRTDNRAINLHWVTRKENNNNPLTLQHFFDSNKGKNKGEKCYWYGKFGKEHHRSIPIMQYDLQGNFIAEFDCTQEVERKLGICHGMVLRVLKGQRNHTHGYIFRYKEQSQNKAI